MARAARELGLDVLVATRARGAREAIEATGARVVALEAERGSLNPMTAGYAAGQLGAILRAEKPDIVHCIALRPILLGGTAAAMAGIPRRVFAVTGLGYLGAGNDVVRRTARAGVKAVIRNTLETTRTHYLFENPDDPLLLGLAPTDRRVTILGGAGIDPEALTPGPLPPSPPLKIAVVARMLWSKGIDVAVDAVRLARSRGVRVELDLFGAPDPSNPRSIPDKTLQSWDREDGIFWRGPTADVAGVFAAHHVGCLPSRGGEGLPRTLLEAAACGRALLTTDVPGCRALVRDGVEGYLTPPGDAVALADAMTRLVADPALVARMGAAARARVLDGFTERDVRDAVKRVYEGLLAS
jgi:glycosyltransferase involved in cell wall biosynthesis